MESTSRGDIVVFPPRHSAPPGKRLEKATPSSLRKHRAGKWPSDRPAQHGALGHPAAP